MIVNVRSVIHNIVMPKRPPVIGQQLINDFQTAIASIETTQAAQYEAERSENALVEHLRSISTGYYLQPGALAQDNQDAVTKASLDAHIKKVQAEQIVQLNAEQLADLQFRSKNDFLNRKVRISVTDRKANPIESVWFDSVTGYRTNATKRRRVLGRIEDILLDRNAIVIKPIGMTKLFNSGLQSFIIYVIDPDTLQPAISVEIL